MTHLIKTTDAPTNQDLIQMNEIYDGLLPLLEQWIFKAANHYLDNYDGGQWDILFYSGRDGQTIVLWKPPSDDKSHVTLRTESGHGSIETTALAASWALTGLVVNHASWALYEAGKQDAAEAMVEQWEAIRTSYPEAGLSEDEITAVWKFLD